MGQKIRSQTRRDVATSEIKNTGELTKAAEPITQTDLEVKTSNMRKTVIETCIIYLLSNQFPNRSKSVPTSSANW